MNDTEKYSQGIPIPRPAKPQHGNYQLPSLIGVTREGMVSSFTSIASVSALLSVMEVVFLLLLKIVPSGASTELRTPSFQKVVCALTYTGLALNIGSSWSAIRMIDVLGKMPLLNAIYEASSDSKRGSLILSGKATPHAVMATFGLRGIWTFVAWHCVLSFLFGSLCMMVQIAMLVWLFEALAVSVIVTTLLAYASLPILFTFAS